MKTETQQLLESEYALSLQQGGTKAEFSKSLVRRALTEMSEMDQLNRRYFSDVERMNALESACAYVKFESEDEGEPPRAHVYAPDENGEYKLAADGDNYREAVDAFMNR